VYELRFDVPLDKE